MSTSRASHRSFSEYAPTRPESAMRPVDGTLSNSCPMVVFPEDDAELRKAAHYIRQAAPRNGWDERELTELLEILGLGVGEVTEAFDLEGSE